MSLWAKVAARIESRILELSWFLAITPSFQRSGKKRSQQSTEYPVPAGAVRLPLLGSC